MLVMIDGDLVLLWRTKVQKRGLPSFREVAKTTCIGSLVDKKIAKSHVESWYATMIQNRSEEIMCVFPMDS